MKTIRVNDDKYIVIHDGEAYTIVRNGRRFTGCGVTGTLASIKHLILTHSNLGMPIMKDSADVMPPVADAMPPDNDSTGVWNCLHPCAIIAMELNKPTWIQQPENLAMVMKTMDAFGWTTPSGEIDFNRVLRDIVSFGSAENGSN